MLPPMNAPGLARSSAIIECSRLTPPGRSSRAAICDNDSPALTGPYSLAATACRTAAVAAALGGVGAGRGVAVAIALLRRAGSARVACGTGTDTGAAARAGARGGGVTTAMGGGGNGRSITSGRATTGASIGDCTGADTVRGVSTSAEYSRTRRPCPQSTWTRNVSSGSLTGCALVTRMIGRPALLSAGANCRPATMPRGGCRPTRANVSGAASPARNPSSSAGSWEIIGISASNGWPMRDLTSICPKPSAAAPALASVSASARAIFNDGCRNKSFKSNP